MNIFASVANTIRRGSERRLALRTQRRLIFEPLENRILLSADFMSPPPDPNMAQALKSELLASQVQAGQTIGMKAGGLQQVANSLPSVSSVAVKADVSREIVFVDSTVSNYQSLLGELNGSAQAGSRDIEVVILDQGSSGLDQISQFLAGRQDISAIHILSHGSNGSLKLGSSILDGDNLNRYADQLGRWGDSLTSTSDILLYGCNVAADASGIDFVNRISTLTGADVAASNNLTGGAGYGDWTLEFATGQIDVAQAFSTVAEADYASALAFTQTPAAATAAGADVFTFTALAGEAVDALNAAAALQPVDVLDFSAVATPLTFTISNGSVTVSDGNAANNVTANNFEKIIGGSGNDTYIFNAGWGNITIQDVAGTNNADFGLVANQLTSSVGVGTFTLTDALAPANTATLDSGFGLNLDLTAYKTQIDTYLTQLQSFGNTLDTFGQFANALPGINQTLGTVLNVADMLNQFRSDISTYINGANPTSNGLVTLLGGLAVNATPNAAGAITGGYGAVTSAVNVAAGGVELGFSLDFNVTRTVNLAIDLGSNAALQGITLPTAKVSVGATFDLNAVLGIQLNASPAVFLDVNNLSGSASVNAVLNGISVDFGFLTATASGGSFNLAAALQAQFSDPAGNGVNRLSLSEITGAVAAPSTLIANLNSRGIGAGGVAGNPSFTFSLPVTVSGVAGVTGGTITAALANVFSGQSPTVTASNGLTDFGNIGATDMLGMLRQLDDWLSQLSGTSILNQKVPMTQNTTLGDTLNFGVAFKNDVLNGLFTIDAQGNQTPNFSSAQTLAGKLTSALNAVGVAGTVAAVFNATTRELRYRLDWTHSFVNTSVPANFQLDLGSLAGIQSTSNIPITANATLGFDFGIGLTPSQQLTIAPPNFVPNSNKVPGDGKTVGSGQLSANASFNVTLFTTTTVTDANGVVISTAHAAPMLNTVTVAKSTTVTNMNPGDMVAPVQNALDAAFGANMVTASYDGSRIVLAAVNPAATNAGGQTTAITHTIEVGAALGNTAYSELGLPPATLTGAANFNVTVTTPSTGAAVTKAVAVTTAATAANQTIADLTADVQAAVDMVFHGQLRGGAIALGLSGNGAPVDFNALMARDQVFQLQIVDGGTTIQVPVTLVAATLNTNLANVGTGAGQFANDMDALRATLQSAVNTALAPPGIYKVTVTANGNTLALTAQFQSLTAPRSVIVNVLQPDVVVTHQGGRIQMNATPTTLTTTNAGTGVTTTTNVNRSVQLGALSNDPAYSVLGLLNQPTPVNGILSSNAEFNIKVNGTNNNVLVATDPTNASIADLVIDVNTALSIAGIGGSVQAFQVVDSGGNLTNAIGFRTIAGSGVSSLIVSVPKSLSAGGVNAAATDLGFDPDSDIVQKARATAFFIDNAALSGAVTFDMSAISGSANFGFLGVDITSTAGDAISGTASLGLVNPTALGGGTRVLVSTLADNLRGGTIGSVVSGTVTGNANVNLVMTPQAGFFAGAIPTANFSITLPNNFDWLNNQVVNTAAPATPVAGELHVSTNFTVITGALSDFTNFQNMGFADIIVALNQVVDYLHQTEGTTAGGGSAGSALVGVLDKKIPVINQSATDLIGLADRFAQVVNQLQSQQAQSIQLADRLIKQALGLPLGTTAAPTPSVMKFDTSGINQTLRLDIPFTVAVNKTLPIDLDLVALGSLAGITFPSKMKKFVGVSSTGDLNLSATANLNLALGMEITGTGAAVSFTPFLYTGAGNTSLDFNISATGSNLNFTAQAGPFGISVINGSASASEGIVFTMNGGGRHFFSAGFSAADFNIAAPTGTASASLPTFFPNPSTPIGGVGNNLFTLDVKSVGGLFDTVSFPQVPSFSGLIALTPLGMLSNPAILIDGLDTLLLTLQDSLNSQVLSVNLPILGDALQPATQFISGFRNDLLAPLSLNLRAAGGPADQIVANTLFNVFGSAADGASKQFGLGQLGLLQDINADGIINTKDIVRQGFGLTDTFGQFDFTIGQSYVWNKPIGFDLGLPALALDLNASVQLTIDWSLRFSFGVDQTQGFYFYTSNNKPVIQVNPVSGFNELVPGTVPFAGTTPNEMNINLSAQLLGLGGASASATGTLGFLKVKAVDGQYDTTGNLITGTNTSLSLNFSVDLKDPNNNDGKLTFAEMVAPSTSFGKILSAQATGSAHAGFKTTVDFSGLNISIPGISLPSLLPKIKFDFSGNWGLSTPSFDINNPFALNLPSIQFNTIQLDVGSFISDFAKPLLDQIKFVLGPLDWLIGPSGMLNMRLPLISDLMGRSISLGTLASWYDPSAKIQPFLNTVQDIYNLINLAIKAAQEPGNLILDFGTLDLSSFGDLRTMKSVKGLNSPTWSGTAVQGQIPAGDTSSKAQFTRSVTKTGGAFTFDILKPVTVFKLLLGSNDVNLVTVDLPKLSFDFNYLQRFPIFPPLFATLQGGFSASVDLAIGYDTRGLTQFQLTHNANNLINGFFFHDLSLTTGVDKPEATLTGFIAAGAQINAVVASAGVSGGITTGVFFNLNDPDADGKVRLSEMAGNMQLNNNNPLSIFDISGRVDWFFKAFAKVGVTVFGKFIGWKKTMNLGGGNLFNFNIGFARPPITAQNVNGELWVNVGPNAASRINGNIQDGNETVVVSNVGLNTYNVTVDGYTQQYIGNFSKIYIDGGAGNDSITLNNISKPVEVHGGTGNDTITLNNVTTAMLAPVPLTGSPFGINIFGEDGNDTINLAASSGSTLIRGGKGDDTITGGAGNDQIYGEAGNDILNGGAGNDQLTGGIGNDVLAGGAGNDTYFFANNFGKDTVNDIAGVLDTWDFTKVTTDINVTLNAIGTKADVVTGQGTVTDSVKEVTSLLAVENLLGGRGADTFDVFNVGGNNLTLNGQGGSDTYILNSPLVSAGGQVILNDTGNLWDRDALIAKGSVNADVITVTDQLLTIGATSTNFGTGGGIETMEVLGFAGNDIINILATPKTMSVSVDGGTGSDVITVGTPAVFSLNGVAGPTVFGLNGIQGDPVLTGNLSIKGGSALPGAPAETDVLNVIDAADTLANTGQMTDSLITGLGMAVGIDYATIETLNVQLGSAADIFTVQSTIGGTTNVFGNNGADILDIQNAAGTFTADGGLGNDMITLRSTALATNATLLGQAGNDQLNVLSVAGPTTVRGGANDDVINIGSQAPLVTGGVVNNIQGLVTVSGDAGIDILNVDDSGDPASNVGILTSSMLTGLGMSNGIGYTAVEILNLNMAVGSNTLDVLGTSALTNVVGGVGQNVFNISSDAPVNFGILDQIQGILNITSNGQDTLNISDFGRLLPDTVTVSNQTVTGLSHAAINYFEAAGMFSGGINIMTGQGADTINVTSTLPGDVTSVWSNAGSDVITAIGNGANGLLVTFAGAGSDTIDASAWNTGMVGFGDNGTVNYSGPIRNPFTIVTALTGQPSVGGNDVLIGGTGNDYLFGGFGSDNITGGSGDDFLIGDSGQVSFANGVATQVGTLNFFIGGTDTLNGGAGSNFLFGGAASDVLVGSLSSDVMFGDNGRVSLVNGKLTSAVMLGQPNLDLIASTMFGLFGSPFVEYQTASEYVADLSSTISGTRLTETATTVANEYDADDSVFSYFREVDSHRYSLETGQGAGFGYALTSPVASATFNSAIIAPTHGESSSVSKQGDGIDVSDEGQPDQAKPSVPATILAALAGWQVLTSNRREGRSAEGTKQNSRDVTNEALSNREWLIENTAKTGKPATSKLVSWG